MKFNNIYEKKIFIGDIPIIVLTPKNDSKLYPTIIFYHGWGSNIEKQRFRGFILCSLGYQVLIPCAIYHGERNSIDHNDINIASKYFWRVILKNIEESQIIIEYAINNLKTDSKRIGVSGNSMGGFTAAGIFALHKYLKSLVVLNGSCNWQCSNNIFLEKLNIFNKNMLPIKIHDKIDKYNPMNNLQNIVNRPILLLHGDKDTLVSIEAQRLFYKETSTLYDDSNMIKLIEYPELNHFVTTNMMEEMAKWFNKYL